MPPKTQNEPDYFRVSPQILQPLGLEQLQDPGLAILELIKNSWDADAHEVSVEVSGKGVPRRVKVSDDGSGMSLAEFREHWEVLGDSHKRTIQVTDNLRPIIGEKGLGRLACFALGNRVIITSRKSRETAFKVEIDWTELMAAQSLDRYPITIKEASRSVGTTVEITYLRNEWTIDDDDFLSQHVEFLAIPAKNDKFTVYLDVDGKKRVIPTRPDVLDGYAEAELLIRIEDGLPAIHRALVGKESFADVIFRPLREGFKDERLDGATIKLLFFRRAKSNGSSDLLREGNIKGLLDRYEGVRIFRDGLNVPPYGIAGSDWAKLEKQRTSTGGPTMVPGNSQLIGEVHLKRKLHPHLAITAGRGGFADQDSVARLAEFVRWGARCIGTIRRAAQLGIHKGDVPPRVDEQPARAERKLPVDRFRKVMQSVSAQPEVSTIPSVDELISVGKEFLSQYQAELRTARIYAQLATTGASAASFAHELRMNFDAVDEIVSDFYKRRRTLPSVSKTIPLLAQAWKAISGFVGLFRLLPVKVRREQQDLSKVELKKDLQKLITGIPHTGIKVRATIRLEKQLRMSPAELDSIVLNLYTNAIKAIRESPNRNSGQIHIRLSSTTEDLKIEVLDNGCGVSTSIAKVMWQPIEGAFTEGTGMGLPITRFLAGLYRGTVSYIDKPEPSFATSFVVLLRGVMRA